MRRARYWHIPLALLFVASAWAGEPVTAIRSYAHDVGAFTQGLVAERGLLYESSGLYGHSTLSVRELTSGRILRRINLPKTAFGEGIALVGDEIIQLTWRERQAYVYDKATLRLKRTLPYAWEGWGLTYDGRHLIASDGSAQLRFLDPVSLQEIHRLEVTDNGARVDQLNELEYVKGEILANRYGEDRIARISPHSGRVIAWIELGHLYPATLRSAQDAVLNGIAYDAASEVLIVTGKRWPKLFLLPAP